MLPSKEWDMQFAQNKVKVPNTIKNKITQLTSSHPPCVFIVFFFFFVTRDLVKSGGVQKILQFDSLDNEILLGLIANLISL